MATKYPKTPEGVLCWIQIPARDLAKLQAFYAAAFPNWTWRKNESKPERVISFTVSENQHGGLVQMPPGAPVAAEQIMGSGMTNYFFVNSIEESTARIEKLGAKTVLQKTPEGNNGWYSNLIDIEGNRFGLYEIHPDMLES